MSARLLAVFGSGETAPTMTKHHRDLLARSAGGPRVMLDTPYGFQENADDISERALEYFQRSLQTDVVVASVRNADIDPVALASAQARITEASWLFTGPGSPSYALRQWAKTNIAELVVSKVRNGGTVIFSSAAALTLGTRTIPVYEIYKVGATPYWLDGLNIIGAVCSMRAVVIPHYDNAEGGNHDTRFCYLGERRLVALERELDADEFVLGVDEHTGLVLDLDAGTAAVVGKGVVTIRKDGASEVLPAGTTVSIDALRPGGSGMAVSARTATASVVVAPSSDTVAATLGGAVDAAERAFADAIAARNVAAAVAALLGLEQSIDEWSADTTQSTDGDRARATLRSMIVRLGDLAQRGAQDPRTVVGPLVELVLDARRGARERKDWAASDAIRDGLVAAGVEVRDTRDGVEWDVTTG
jgi:cyanophycinase-like exopeptidase